MTQPSFKRKLSAILSADVKGYSRLMSQDEVGTIQTLKSHRKVISDLVQQYEGRVVDSPGDNILAEFSIVSTAVNCAVKIQKELAGLDSDEPSTRKMEWRIGINLGEVVEEEGRIYGDGVNIAARIESLAEAGGICISGRVYDQVKSKLGLEFEFLGEHTVKNIAGPVRVYKVLSQQKRVKENKDKVKSSTSEKPSIAVLPFDNLSGDPDQEYFSDGITEDIITRLSMNSMLFVIARNSTFVYKGQPVKIQQVGQELGVRYVLEGSVRKAGNMVRITAQLIESATEGHVWAETYDSELTDIFSIQDEITEKIVRSLSSLSGEGGIWQAERARVKRIPTENMNAYDCVLKGLSYHRNMTTEDLVKAQEMYEKAIELDPEFALAYTLLGTKYQYEYIFVDGGQQALERSFELFNKAILLGDNTSLAHAWLANYYKFKGEFELALAETERAIKVNPNSAFTWVIICSINNQIGRPEKALEAIKTAIKLDPHYNVSYLTEMSWAYRGLGKYAESIVSLNEAFTQNPNWVMVHSEFASNYLERWATQQEINPRVLDKALESLKRGLTLEENSYLIRWLLIATYLWKKQHDRANAEIEKLVAIAPENLRGYGILAYIENSFGIQGNILNYVGQYEETVERAEKASEINPAMTGSLCQAYRLAGKPEKALSLIEQRDKFKAFPGSYNLHLELTILFSELDREEEARSEAEELLKLVPNFSVEVYGQRIPYQDPAMAERDMVALRKAGLK